VATLPAAGQAFRPKLSVVSVRALPVAAQHGASRAPLLTGSLNTVVATNALAFRVVIHNDGEATEGQVHVVLQIARSAAQGGPTVHQMTVAKLPPHNTRAVTFQKLGAVPFATKTTVVVSVPGANSKVYPVIFALPG